MIFMYVCWQWLLSQSYDQNQRFFEIVTEKEKYFDEQKRLYGSNELVSTVSIRNGLGFGLQG
jgi:hypothetical protein